MAHILYSEDFQPYISAFNAQDEEPYHQFIPNQHVWEFLKTNIPLFACPDHELEQIYYFRWWTYRKHLKQTPDGFVITEFLPPVPWAGKHNTISCAAGHHFYEGRWLHNQQYLDDYANFWFRAGGDPRSYSFWAADALWAYYRVKKNLALLTELFDDLVANYQAWEQGWEYTYDGLAAHVGQHPNGLFFQFDDREGSEMSIGGHGYRPSINSYMYGDAMALAEMAELLGKKTLAQAYRQKAVRLNQLVQKKLWDSVANFFKVLPADKDAACVDVREIFGYTPWYVNLPDPGYESAWSRLLDPQGFYAPFGPTTAEQRHAQFKISYENHECQWNGPSWPFSTSMTLTALANLLNNYQQTVIGKDDYFSLLKIYATSHQIEREDGQRVPWIDENLNPFTGDWISRTRLKSWQDGTWSQEKGGQERGKDYNHSTFCDLVITGLVGLRPRQDNLLEVNPLIPDGVWDWFCLDNILYHGYTITIAWDKTGKKYGKGQGLQLFANGKSLAQSNGIQRLLGKLPVEGNHDMEDLW